MVLLPHCLTATIIGGHGLVLELVSANKCNVNSLHHTEFYFFGSDSEYSIYVIFLICMLDSSQML